MLFFWIFLGAGLFFLLQRILYLRRWDKGLRLSLRFDVPAVTAGETVSVIERVENRKRLPLPVFSYKYVLCRNLNTVTETGGGEREIRIKLAVPAMRAVRNRTQISGLPRGVYTLTNVTMSARDLFYTCRPGRQIVAPAKLTVYPTPIPARRLALPFRQLLGAITTRRLTTEDPFELRGIRPYEIFDSMRDINWKASARTGELKVNQHMYTTDEALLLLLDMDRGTEAQRETMLSLASSLSRLLLARGVTVSLRGNCRSCITGRALSLPPGGGSSHQAVLDEALAQVKLSASTVAPFAEFVRTIPARELAGSLPVVLSAGTAQVTFPGKESFFLSVSGMEPSPLPGVTVLPWQEAGTEEVRL